MAIDPWTSNRYGFAGGNPITGIELDGHCPMADEGGCDTNANYTGYDPPTSVSDVPPPTTSRSTGACIHTCSIPYVGTGTGTRIDIDVDPEALGNVLKDSAITAAGAASMALGVNGLALGRSLWLEAVDLEAAGDADDAGLIFAGGEVAGLLGGTWAGSVGTVADEESRVDNLEQEGRQGQVSLVRGENPP